ncbi:MAG: sarcosine oxidase subunit delta, partial [Pseudomonadota bacterium]|nr:sarcosine oxidase subunit delta [Pseudomonadota bacterium]
MLLIRCPYCEQDRPEVEFSYAHQAHKPRPEAAEGELDDHNWARWVYFQKNIK